MTVIWEVFPPQKHFGCTTDCQFKRFGNESKLRKGIVVFRDIL